MSSYRIEGESGEWEMVVGLEIHAQVVSHAKLFSDAPTDFGAEDLGIIRDDGVLLRAEVETVCTDARGRENFAARQRLDGSPADTAPHSER